MTQWARPPESRDQMILFPTRLDEAVPKDHPVRWLDFFLGQLNWSGWESHYCVNLGQPAIHPRVMAGVILYGLLTRIRSSRALEEALKVRLDFRWLVEGRTIDHSTLSEFRRKHPEALKDLFVQIGLLAREMDCLSLEMLAFDGTRMRSNSRRRSSRTLAELQQAQAELRARFAELESRVAENDAQEEELLASESARSEELADLERRQKQVDAALAEFARLETSEETVPKRIPLTDPESRLTPNKEGGFAPNYTPLAMVDVDSGLIVSADVIAMTDEDKHLISAVESVQEQFNLPEPPPEILADGLMATGENLAACAERDITLYAPLRGTDDSKNPALRDDPTQPVPPEDWDQLPTKSVKRKGRTSKQLAKSAFVYDEQHNCYWCAWGKQLTHTQTTSERIGSGARCQRSRYKADPKDCADCPLRDLCLQNHAKRRQINRDQHETLRVKHAEKMATDEAKQKYARRKHAGERPFAVIKQQFGARQFLLRGRAKVQQEWRWLVTAFNLNRLFGLMCSGAGPPGTAHALC